jgi:hypothetical protein
MENFLIEAQKFENTKFVSEFYRKYFMDARAHFLQRAFGKELSNKIRGYGAQALQSVVASNDMTIYQIIPADLHGTIFFKIA